MDITPELLARYWEDTCTHEEKEFIDSQWSYVKHHPVFQEFMELQWDAAGGDASRLSTPQKQALYASLQARMRPSVKTSTFKFPVLRWAAVLAFLIAAAGVLTFQKDKIGAWVMTQTTVVAEAPIGAVKIVTLYDGSKVWLNAGSRLTYNEYLLGDTRRVYLDGEAFFEVMRNPDKPFIVNTDKMRTKVLGTSFNVKFIQALEVFEVTVSTGKVEVSKGNKILSVLNASERISMNRDKTVSRASLHGYNAAAWRDGSLKFFDQDFEEIAWHLEKRFGVAIHINNGVIKKYRFTGDFTGMSLDQVLDVMRELHNFKVVRSNQELRILSPEDPR